MLLWGFMTVWKNDESNNMMALLPLLPCVLRYPYFQYQIHSSSEEPQ